jgi:hypothetical protein
VFCLFSRSSSTLNKYLNSLSKEDVVKTLHLSLTEFPPFLNVMISCNIIKINELDGLAGILRKSLIEGDIELFQNIINIERVRKEINVNGGCESLADILKVSINQKHTEAALTIINMERFQNEVDTNGEYGLVSILNIAEENETIKSAIMNIKKINLRETNLEGLNWGFSFFPVCWSIIIKKFLALKNI